MSVYMDIDGKCLQGSKPPFDFNKTHLGNGVCQYGRKDIYSGGLMKGLVLRFCPVLFITVEHY